MSARTVIDGLEFSRADKEMRGSLHAAELARLQDSLFDAEGQVDFLLKGGRDRRGRPTLYLEISGLLRLRCQRCMGPLRYPLYVANALLLVRADEPLPEETDAPDAPDCVRGGRGHGCGNVNRRRDFARTPVRAAPSRRNMRRAR